MTTQQQYEEKNARVRIATRLGIPESWLLLVFTIESGNIPSRVNQSTGATGLIQFMPATAKGLGTTVAALGKMSYSDQLEYVYKYLAPYKSKLKSPADLYLTVFYPYAVGKPDSYILGSERSTDFSRAIFNQNPGFRNEQNKNRGYYTKSDITRYVDAYAQRLGMKEIKQRPKIFIALSNLFKQLFG